jgi:hypothetical protein
MTVRKPIMTQRLSERRRTVLKTVGGVVLVGTLAGCTGGSEEEPDEPEEGEEEPEEPEEPEEEEEPEEDDEEMAMVRAAHLSPDAPNVDVYVADDPVLEDVAFREVSEYLELEPDAYEVRITAAGDEDTVVFDEEVEVDEGAYTLAAVGELEEENQPFEVLVLEDDLSDPGEDARVRVVHASPDAPTVDVAEAESGDLLIRRSGSATTTRSRSPRASTRSRSGPPARRRGSPSSTSRSRAAASTAPSPWATSNPTTRRPTRSSTSRSSRTRSSVRKGASAEADPNPFEPSWSTSGQ